MLTRVMQWNVVVSEEIEDIEEDLGVMNWPESFSSRPGLVQLVNKSREEDWLVYRASLTHGRLDGKDVWAQEIIKITRNDRKHKWTQFDVVQSELIHDDEDKMGLVTIVNERIENNWSVWGELMYSNHNGKDCWTISMVKNDDPRESESLM